MPKRKCCHSEEEFKTSMKECMGQLANVLWNEYIQGDISDVTFDPIVAKHIFIKYADEISEQWYGEELSDAAPVYPSGISCGIRCPPPHEDCSVRQHRLENYKFHEDKKCNDFILSLHKRKE